MALWIWRCPLAPKWKIWTDTALEWDIQHERFKQRWSVFAAILQLKGNSLPSEDLPEIFHPS